MDRREQAKLNMGRSVGTFVAQAPVVAATASTLATGELIDSIALIENLDTEAEAAARGDSGNKTGQRALAATTGLIVDRQDHRMGCPARPPGTHPALDADYQATRVIYDAATRSREEAPATPATPAKPAGGS